jgi:UDP-N-acetyl-D-mannosaminuronate dehydrogenase
MESIVANTTTGTFHAVLEASESRTTLAGIIGMGYAGCGLHCCFPKSASVERFRVTGFDVDHGKVEILSFGGPYICTTTGLKPVGYIATESRGLRLQAA